MIDVESYQWIGIIHQDNLKENVAFLTPLAFFDDESRTWEPLTWQAHKSCFPNAGKVAWPRGPSEWRSELLYSFRVEPAQGREEFKDSPTYSYYRIAGSPWPSPEGLAQVLDWSTTPRERLVARLSESFTRPCYTKTIYIQHGRQLYGPIPLDSERLRPLAYSNGTTEQTLHVSVCDPPQDEQAILTFQLDNGEELRLLAVEPRAGTEQQDWSPPGVIIKQLIKAHRMLSQVGDDDLGQMRYVLKAFKHALSTQEPSVCPLLPDTVARACLLLQEEEQAIASLAEFSDFLLQLPTVQRQLKAACEEASQQAYEAALQQVRQELTLFRHKQEESIARELEARFAEQRQQLAAGQRQLDRLTHSLKEASDELELYEEEIINKKKEIETQKRLLQKEEAQLQAFEAHFRQRLEELQQQPLEALSQVLADHWLLAASAGRDSRPGSSSDMGSGRGTGPAHPQSAEQLWPELAKAGSGKFIPDPSTLLDLVTVRQAARQHGAKPAAVRLCILALLAGLIPTLSGPVALATLEALSLVLSAGRLCRVAIPLTAMQPLDLFGQLRPTERLFLPASSSLADTVLWAAEHPEQLAIVVLEGLDRLPGAPVYVPLLQQYIALQQRPAARPTPVPLFHPQALPSDDPYRSLAAFRWPGNLLLTATCDDDLHSLPLPKITRGWLVHLDPSQLTLNRNQQQLNGRQERSEIAATDWHRWRLTVNQALVSAASNEASASASSPIVGLLKQTASCFDCSFDEHLLSKAALDPSTGPAASLEEVD
ncbi:hypothetical protein [Thermogemmatispora tikiterensis]|uniref:Uncharacterized protein n=1 Tax=Thermogemmatispora tikiterensis TaxID=1825093 RepID=A0A328VPS8_9CHLR|nr:hypothetical protein [Thermogemmatispora tikiterensis]RAQ97693.1 hypothetical protein A4R35_19295 [Thermogemmatispora tikiterensis]